MMYYNNSYQLNLSYLLVSQVYKYLFIINWTSYCRGYVVVVGQKQAPRGVL